MCNSGDYYKDMQAAVSPHTDNLDSAAFSQSARGKCFRTKNTREGQKCNSVLIDARL